MTLRAARLLLAACALLSAAPAHAQQTGRGLQVTPVLIQIPTERRLGSFRVHNGRAQDTSFEIQAFAWRQTDGETELTPTSDLVVAPSVFIVPAGGDQIVRLGMPAAPQGAGEQSYRLILRELPDPSVPVQGFRIQLEMSLPVFITPIGAHGALEVTRTHGGDGAPSIVLHNTGAARLQLSPASAQGPAIAGMPRYLLAGQSAVRPMPAGAHSINILTASAGDTTPRPHTIELGDAPVLADAR